MHRWRKIKAKERDRQRKHQHVLYGSIGTGHRVTVPPVMGVVQQQHHPSMSYAKHPSLETNQNMT